MLYVAQVWPGATHFPDFLSEAGVQYWAEQLQDFHKLAEYDGLWIDMNEASNFCTGEVCHLPSGNAHLLNADCSEGTQLPLMFATRPIRMSAVMLLVAMQVVCMQS